MIPSSYEINKIKKYQDGLRYQLWMTEIYKQEIIEKRNTMLKESG